MKQIVTITAADCEQVRQEKAYCPLAAALARTFPHQTDPFHIGYATCIIGGQLWYIGSELQQEVIEPYDHEGLSAVLTPTSGAIYDSWEAWEREDGGRIDG